MATLAERLVEAETAYHNVMTGGAVTKIRDQNGEEISYSQINPSRLLAYIATLKNLIAAEATGIPTCEGPLRPFFL